MWRYLQEREADITHLQDVVSFAAIEYSVIALVLNECHFRQLGNVRGGLKYKVIGTPFVQDLRNAEHFWAYYTDSSCSSVRSYSTTADTRKACKCQLLIDLSWLTKFVILLKIERLQEESDAIRWQVISRQSTITFGDSAASRFLDIQSQVVQVGIIILSGN